MTLFCFSASIARGDATSCFLYDTMETYSAETVAVWQMTFSRDVRAALLRYEPAG